MSVFSRSNLARLAGAAAVATAALLPLTVSTPAHAWWRAGWGYGGGVYFAPPPVYYAPPVVYAPPPVVYAPGPVWIAPHWSRGYWIRGHWR